MQKLRKALSAELTQIYMMGYDTWGEHQAVTAYLQECRLSTKYQQGTWWVLEEQRQHRTVFVSESAHFLHIVYENVGI
ncbi:hypothetical protein [Oenococcus sp.]|uniref:hypothetical protein n=1 Tax=Oenococcus sp. TaxID=1979414 RepID=UPI0039ECB452